MKTINFSEFEADMGKTLDDVTSLGEFVRVVRENGANFVIMEESECDILLNMARMLLAASASVNTDEQTISISDTLQGFDRLKQ